MSQVYIGTSGWVYKSWETGFYPEDIPPREQFQFYRTQFPTVEINATFYRLPSLKMVRSWRDKAPEGFVFAVKGSRYITHLKRLSELDGALNTFIRRISPLRSRMGPILWQLPPTFRKNPARLHEFLRRLPDAYRHALEFRHESWFDEETYDLLRRCRVALVSVSSLRMPMNLTITTDFVYLRFHGLRDGAAHNYSRTELKPWARHIRQQARAGRTVYAYFNNDANVRAPANAMMLRDMVGALSVRPPAAIAASPPVIAPRDERF